MEAENIDLDSATNGDIGSVLSSDFDEIIEVLGVTYQMDNEISEVCNEVGLLNFCLMFYLTVAISHEIDIWNFS